jgi:8-oxo-dGTP pyrophosphatase MutT (NUDIX family)
MMEGVLSLSGIRRALASHQPTILPVDRPHAAVALLLAEARPTAEVLFIVRAHHDHDPWSGDIGFPGGRVAARETDPRATAEREAYEEVALDLSRAEHLGRLDDIYGATLPVLVSGFVYAVASRPLLHPNHEVAGTFWIPLDRLGDPARHRQECFEYRGQTTTQPVAELLGPDEPLLWGITYRLLRNFFAILGLPFGLKSPDLSPDLSCLPPFHR